MALLLALGFAIVHIAERGGTNVSKEDAVAIAREKIDFEPTDHQVRYLRRGIPSHGYWVVSYYIEKPEGGYERVTVVLIDASTGKVTEVRRTT
jgi:hypothetical protein